MACLPGTHLPSAEITLTLNIDIRSIDGDRWDLTLRSIDGDGDPVSPSPSTPIDMSMAIDIDFPSIAAEPCLRAGELNLYWGCDFDEGVPKGGVFH